MFSPEGFISLNEVSEILLELAQEWRLETPHEDDPNPEGISGPGAFDFYDPDWKRSAAYKEWLFQSFLKRHEENLFVCTLSGSAIKLSQTLVMRDRVYDGYFEDTKDAWTRVRTH